ncbi:MAG: LysR substrate-binding domain-containing protein [Xanthomonadales bacterium]|nr:LysR substrate-binding domain-containing protein [Xanthomonadales bacterium]
MPQPDLNDYFYFVHVVEKRGFSAASEALGIPKSRLSRHIRQLEERMDARLIQRTTRQFNVTELGEIFYGHARAVVDETEKAENAVRRKKNLLSGNVTISCSVGVAQFALKPLIAQFLSENPLVNVSQQVTNQNIDLVAAGVDLSIRGHSGPLPDSSLIQRQLAQVEWQLFAASDYLDGHPELAHPSDLDKHQTLSLGWQSPHGQWNLHKQSGEKLTVDITPRLKSDDMATLKHAAARGAGIVALPAYTCRDEIENGQLQRVLPLWHAGAAQLSLVTPSRKGQPQSVIALQDFLLAEFANIVALP